MDIIPLSLRLDFREWCASHLTLRPIAENFEGAGFEWAGIQLSPSISGDRRISIEQYYASCDWTKLRDAQKMLNVMSLILSQSYEENARQEVRDMCLRHGLIVDNTRVQLSGSSGREDVKNLIFAANGPKPDIVLADALINEIQVVRNQQYCLVYNKPILSRGLLWTDLVEWWMELTDTTQESRVQAERALYSRLKEALSSSPERLLFKAYYQCLRTDLAERLPALIPQVYLHYDPYSLKILANGKRLLRQRMDFLLLLSQHTRIVIEIDGQQHYSKDGQAQPQLYAEMVSEDRRIRLAGYEVYRFGGYEFQKEEEGVKVVCEFFRALFDRKLA